MEHRQPSATTHDSNCFDVIRHAAAFLVMISHHFALNGLPEPKIFGSTKLGTLAVIIFFSISGYLITSSFINSKTTISYIKKRVLRIFPGLIACSFIMTLLIFPFFGKNHSPIEWIASVNSIKSFVFFSLFGSPGSGDLVNGFTNNYVFPNSANGSLWSLKFEFFDYIAIFIIFSIIKKPIIASLAFILISFTALTINSKFHLSDYYLYRTAEYSIPFAMGALLFSTKHLWVNRKAAKAAMTVLSFSVLFITGDKSELSLIVLTMVPVLVICMGLSFRDTLIKGKFDISYGVYIYAFPVQQIISNYMPNEFAMSLLSSFVTTTVLALISWFVVERRFLARKNKKINIPPGVIPS